MSSGVRVASKIENRRSVSDSRKWIGILKIKEIGVVYLKDSTI